MNWRDYIHTDPSILRGKATLVGTRLAVDFILGLLENGWTPTQVFESYPQVKPEHLQAIFAYSRESIRQDEWLLAA